jgi:hypothetical protein
LRYTLAAAIEDAMPGAISIDHRLALVLLSALILAAAAPIAAAWARLLPAEREAFARPGDARPRQPRDSFAIVLLCFVTISFLIRLPGIPLDAIRPWLEAHLFAPWPERLLGSASFLLVFLPGFASCYAILRPNPLRRPLLWAGVLVLLLWFATPYLSAAWLSPS